MNPYASFLGTRDPLAVIAETPSRLHSMLGHLIVAELDRAPTGKWNIRQVLAHLADTELVFAFRLRQAIADTDHVIQPFDQDAWAMRYDKVDAMASIPLFSTVRRWNIAFLRSLPPEAFAKTLSHPERGPMTFQTVVETMGGHDLNHMAQIEKLLS